MRYTPSEVVIMPKFQKEFPENAGSYFDPASDEDFKRRHPVGYGVLVGCGIGGLVLPLIVFILVTSVFFPAPNSGFLFLAMVGCFIIGIGIFNIIAAWIGQYLGHWVTIGCFLLGGLLVAISCVIVYIPDIYALFDEEMVSYYFMSMLLLALPPIFYMMFRFSIESWLRRKRVSRSRIKKFTKGKRNYWWYEAIHEQYNMGLLYHLNKFLTVFYPITLGLSILLGWLRVMTPIISGLYALISLTVAVMSFFSSVQNNLDEYGAPVVILRQSKSKRIDSIIFDLATAAFPLAAAYAHVLMMVRIIFS